MGKEFKSLSEKGHFTSYDDKDRNVYFEEDVKEAVKRLKEATSFCKIACNEDCCANQRVEEAIHDIFGDKLNEKTTENISNKDV